jgi:hypothetical protein
MHENLDRREEVKEPSNRAFGLVMAGFFSILAVLPWFHAEPAPMRWWAAAISVAFAGLALLWSAPLAPPARLWGRFGLLLHKIVSPIILGLLFYAAIVPVGLLMRAFGKDPLRLRRDAAADSYWIPRQPPGPSPESMKNQF